MFSTRQVPQRFGVIASLLLLLTACGGGGSGSAPSVPIASIAILPTTLAVNVGFSKQLQAAAYDSSNNIIVGATFTWSSADASIATVDSSGNVTGVAAGTTTVTATSGGVTGSAATVDVAPAGDLHPLSINQFTLPAGTAGTPYSVALTASGGSAPYSWAGTTTPPDYLGSGGTNGLTLDPYSGQLSGTPIYGGLIPVTIAVADSYGFTSMVSYEMNVAPGVTTMAITNTPPNGTQGAAYNFQFTTSWTDQTGCLADMLYHSGVIPPGLTFDAAQGTLSGTPLVAGKFTFSLSAGTSSACEPSVSNRFTDIYTYTMDIAPGTNAAPLGVSGWTRQSASAVLAPSANGWDDFTASSPSVIKVGNTYMMYYEAEDAANHQPQIGLATSTDGVNWTKQPNPVLTTGAAGAFDAFEVRYPSVVYDGSTYHMWYLGATATCNAIGAATSTDGVTWTKHAGALSLGGCSTYGKNYAPGPVIYQNGTYTMWYWAPAGTVIGVATSTDGIAWTDNGNVAFDSNFATNVSVDRPSVIFDGSTYRMWFGMTLGVNNTGGMDIYRTAIGFASSTDGKNWTAYDDTNSGGTYAIFSPGSAGAWDRPGVGQPWVMLDNGTYRMWYTGGRIGLPIPGAYGYVEGAIGYATIP